MLGGDEVTGERNHFLTFRFGHVIPIARATRWLHMRPIPATMAGGVIASFPRILEAGGPEKIGRLGKCGPVRDVMGQRAREDEANEVRSRSTVEGDMRS